MFRGEFVHTIDSKGRVSVPAEIRMELQRRSDQPPMLTRWSQCLRLYAYEDWCEYENEISGYPTMNPYAEKLRRLVLSGAVSGKIDGQGRLLIPPVLRKAAGIERDVTIAGVGKYVEIWDTERFAEDIGDTQDRYYEITSTLSELAK